MLAHPFVRTWAAAASGSGRDLGGFAGLAAAAALRAGVTAELMVPVRDGVVVLPSLGAIEAGPGVPAVRLRIADGTVAGDPAWRRARELGALRLDDVDPYRDCFTLPVAPRLTGEEAEAWTARLGAALRWITERVPQYRPGLETVLRVVVPLRPGPGSGLRSAAARTAFGAVAVGLAPDAPSLATLLVHEVQHLKLGAVLDVCHLFDQADPRRIMVPWRDDPRPVEAALHGCYAFAAVAEVWRHQRESEAGERSARYRGWVVAVIGQLLTGGGLTPAGCGSSSACGGPWTAGDPVTVRLGPRSVG
ncbi:aKG-HExxH-type peptide beta-hydroxylase [Dactylosporangium sp. CS-047395]|uniref:aKG-HExxH-type peptide beta-hydroxylase n=1 Tax=Dactylosporangium sp. CS-047395 TaxID=3239936 RepID=UPI003D910550